MLMSNRAVVLYSTLASFVGLVDTPSFRPLVRQFTSEFQLKNVLDCFTSFAKTIFLGVFLMNNREKVRND